MCNTLRPNIVTEPKCNILSHTLKLNIVIEQKCDNQINIFNYEDNILYFNSIINEAKNFLDSVPEMIQMISPIIIYKKGIKYNYDILINKSREKFGFIFDYSLTNPKSITHITSEVTTRCMICTYKQTTSVLEHLRKTGCIKCSNKCKWYYEIFIYAAFLIHGNKFIYPIMNLDERFSVKKHFDIICKKCKNVWPTNILNHIHKESGCPECAIEERRWNYEKLMGAVVEIHGYKYDYSKVIPSEITSCDSQLILSCNFCDYGWDTDLNNHINKKHGCPSCAGNAPWTYERFLIAAFRIHGNKYFYGLVKPEDIQGGNSKIKLWCGKCDYYWNPTISAHINGGTGCRSCAKMLPVTYDSFIKSTQTVHRDKYSYELVSPDDIKGAKSVINIICLTCKYQWPTTIDSHINSKYNCPRCLQCLTHTLETLICKIIEIHGNKIDYSLIKDEHIRNNRSNVPLVCNKCKKCWSPTIATLVNKKCGCPRCKISKGERACLKILLSKNICVEEQFKIKELGRKKFDFMIEHEGSKYIIEFDGAQHFKFVEFFHKDIKTFIARQETDILKTSIALKNGYNIIRIDYKQIDNIEFHISEALKLRNKYYFSTPKLYTYITGRLENNIF